VQAAKAGAGALVGIAIGKVEGLDWGIKTSSGRQAGTAAFEPDSGRGY